jgi:hypothetical protein
VRLGGALYSSPACQFRVTHEHLRRVGVPRQVRTRVSSLFRERRLILLDCICASKKKRRNAVERNTLLMLVPAVSALSASRLPTTGIFGRQCDCLTCSRRSAG